MTKLDALRTIGDILTDLDVAIGSLLPSNPLHRQLLDLRLLLDDRQRTLGRLIFDENTDAFQQAGAELEAASDQAHAALSEIDHLNESLDTVRRFFDAAGNLISTVAGLTMHA